MTLDHAFCDLFANHILFLLDTLDHASCSLPVNIVDLTDEPHKILLSF